MTDVTIGDLIDLIDGLDRIDENDYLDLTRWDRGGMGTDEVLTAVVRQLARERLGSFPLEDVGLEMLRQIDRRTPRYQEPT